MKTMLAMPDEAEEHLEDIKDDVEGRLDFQYRRGQKEHGGILSAMPLEDRIENAHEEIIDLLSYLHNAREEIIELKDRIKELESQ